MTAKQNWSGDWYDETIVRSDTVLPRWVRLAAYAVLATIAAPVLFVVYSLVF